jgi:hypothetical protein
VIFIRFQWEVWPGLLGRIGKVAEVRNQQRWGKSKNNNIGNRGD